MATVTNPDKSLIAALGPMKIEVVQLTSVVDADTYNSKLQRPIAALLFPAADADSTTQNPSATVSGKVVTLLDPPVTACTLIVIGF